MDKSLIVVHCSATPPDHDIGVEEIRNWHVVDNGWSDIGYAYVIRRSGKVEKGRDLDGDSDVEDEIGAHAYGFNRESIGVCLAGGVNKHGEPDSNFTIYQYVSLYRLVFRIRKRFPDIEVCGHRELPGVHKSCPCFDVKALLEDEK